MQLTVDVAGMLVGQVWSPTWWWFAVSMFAALVLLDAFDIPLPRGDSVGIGGALSAAALLVLGPLGAASLSLGSMILMAAIRWKTRRHDGLAGRLIARSTSLVISVVILMFFREWSSPWAGSLAAVSIPAIFLSAELVSGLVISAERSGRGFSRLLVGNARTQAPLLVAQWSGAVLFLLIYQGMGPWSLIPVIALLFLMRQSYALLLDIRETYRTTVEVLVEAAESQDERRIGHAERTAVIARAIGDQLGLSASQLEIISYTALLHDLDALGSDSGRLTGAETTEAGKSSDVIKGVEFFAEVLPILQICDGVAAEHVTENQKLAALIVAIAGDVDAIENEGVAAAHNSNAVDVVIPCVSSQTKARVAGATLILGYKVPAMH